MTIYWRVDEISFLDFLCRWFLNQISSAGLIFPWFDCDPTDIVVNIILSEIDIKNQESD